MENKSTMYYGNIAKYMSAKTRILKVPFSGTFELTPRCNMNCKMCYIRMNEKEMEKVGKELPVEEWIRIAEEAVAEGMTMVLLTGGEAVLYKDFKKLFLALRKMGVFISINSNGTTLTDSWLEFFKENPPAKFNITIYGGCNETYERLCGNPKGFDQLTHTIQKLQENNIQVLLNCCVTKQNVNDLEGIYSFAKKHNLTVHATSYNFPPVRKEGVDEIEVSRFTPTEGAKARILIDWNTLTRKEFLKKIDILLEHVEEAESTEDFCGEIKGDKIQCAAGRSNFWVTWDGRMLPCGMIPFMSLPLKGKKVKDVWKEISAQAAEITLAPECKNCNKKKLCMPCAAKVRSETGSYDKKPEYMCEYIDEYLRMIVEAKKILNNE